MLMDLFFDTLEGLDPDIKCRRIHYYDFMQDVHSRMHEAKKKAPPRDISRQEFFLIFSFSMILGWLHNKNHNDIIPCGATNTKTGEANF